MQNIRARGRYAISGRRCWLWLAVAAVWALSPGCGGGGTVMLAPSINSVAPAVSASIGAVDFGNQRVGVSSAPKSVTVSNIGSAALNLSEVNIAGDFAQTNNCGASLAPAANCIVNVTFTPHSTGGQSGSIAIANSTAGSPLKVNLTGAGIFPKAVLSPLPSFGPVRNGDPALTQTVTISNQGTDFLSLPTYKIDGVNRDDFNVVPAAGAGNIPAGDSANLTVGFAPTASGDESATLTFTTDNGDISVTLTGSGVGLASVTISPSNPAVAVGGLLQLKAMGTFSDNTAEDLSTKVAWSSSVTNVATVDANGRVTARGEGTTVITAKKGGVTASTTLTVVSSITISNLSALPTENSASITWSTNVPTDSAVAYGVDASSLTGNASAGVLSTTHSMSISGLQPSTTYTYRVTSTDAAGKSSASGNFTFTTTAAGTSLIPYRIGWTQLSPKTQLSKVCPPNTDQYAFASNCKNVIAAWSGGIADVARNRLIIWGGGHNDYYGNEVYALNVSDQTMVRLNNPGPVADPAANQIALSNGTPNSRHTYGGLGYIAHADRMFVFGGDPAATFGFASNDTWALDLNTLQWQRMDPVTGGSPAHAFGVVSDYDPNTRNVYLHDGQNFWQYTYETNTYRRLDSSSTISIYNSAVIDPKRKLFFIIGGQAPNTPNSNVIQVVDISPGSKYALQTWKTIGCGPLPSAGYPGVAYDPVLDRIVGWAGGNTVYIFNPDTKTCTSSSPAGGPPASQINGTHGRFRYFPGIDGFILVNDASQNAYVLKLSSAQGPKITGVSADPVGLINATISWSTDTPSTSQLEYGTSNAYGSFAPLDPLLVSDHSEVLTGLKPATTYYVRVHSTDADGAENVSPPDFFFTTQADKNPPVVSLAAPTDEPITGAVSLTATASDDVGVAGVQFYVDGIPIGAEQLGSGPSHTFLWNSAVVKDGLHALSVKARDAADNAAVSNFVNVMTSNAIAASEFEKRCQFGGGIRCWDFEDPVATQTHLLPPFGSTALLGEIVTDVVADGLGALRFTVPTMSGADTSGSFSLNFSDDLSRQFDEADEFYVQYRVRYNDVMLHPAPDGIFHGTNGHAISNGFKMNITGEGDRPGEITSSCTVLELVLENSDQQGFPHSYHSCGTFQTLQVPIPNTSEFLDQTAAGCPHYGNQGFAQSEPPCFRYKADEWITMQQHVKIGHWGQPDSTVEVWAADEGQPSRLIISLADFTLLNDRPGQAKYGKVWLLPYQTNKDPSQDTGTGYVWYDSLIVSTRRIPDPDVSAPSPPDLLRAMSVSPGSIDLTWRSNSYGTEAGFAIERCNDLANTCMAQQSLFTQIGTVLPSVTSFHDDGLASGKTYSYRVRAFGTTGEYSAYSGGACFTGANPCYGQDVAK